MAHLSSKIQIFEYLERLTKGFEQEHISSFTTLDICKNLNMSRSLVSLYLNEMVQEGTVIKISSRPVYYLNRTELEKKYHIQLQEQEYLSIQELLKGIYQGRPTPRDFEKAIGCEGSLNYCISQIKSALLYPGGVPILLKGENGSGRTFLMQLIQEYCVNQKLPMKPNAHARIKIQQGTAAAHYEKLIFGISEEQPGLLNELDGGILYIENVGALDQQMQEKLADFITRGSYQRYGSKKSCEGNVRLVMSEDETWSDRISKKLLMRIPIVCDIPSWIERNEDERREFIVRFFCEEETRLDRTIYISEKLIYRLVHYPFENNISELRKCIKRISANAYASGESLQTLNIYLCHLPANLLELSSPDETDSAMLRLDLIKNDGAADKLLELWQNLLHDYEDAGGMLGGFLEKGKRTLKQYYDILIFQESFCDERLGPMEKTVMQLISGIRRKYGMTLPANCAYVIARILIAQQNHNSRIQIWSREHEEQIKKIYLLMSENILEIQNLTEILARQIQSNTNIELSQMNRLFIMLNIHFYNQKLTPMDTAGVVLCHGYATASSIADTVNTTLQVQLLEAIDMPMDSSAAEVGEKLNEFIDANRYYKNIILMVDTGSLEGLGQLVDGAVNLGIINNASTILVLHIANMMLEGRNMREILETACRENQCRYSIVPRVRKEKVIVFTSDAGKNIAEKLIRLLMDSLPSPIPLEMMAYDYEKLEQNGKDDILFEKYEVVLLVKTLNLKIPEVNSVSLEEIINFKNIHVLNEVLSEYLSKEEIEVFNQTLLKNFSLQSVMENLTILNAGKLLDVVSDATTALQHMMKRKFLSKTIVGINMHVCFLIERLVTKTPIKTYRDLEEFQMCHTDFIEAVNESFRTLLNHYYVELPVSEIAYLYYYIENDIQVEESENQF